jgi:hypothetical protein
MLQDSGSATKSCELLGWAFDAVVRAEMLGQRVYAAVALDWPQVVARRRRSQGAVLDRLELELAMAAPSSEFRPPLEIRGVLMAGAATASSVENVAMFAGYAPRAVWVKAVHVPTDVQMVAAVLGVGVVSGVQHLELVATAGPRAEGTRFSAHEWYLRETAFQAWLDSPRSGAASA